VAQAVSVVAVSQVGGAVEGPAGEGDFCRRTNGRFSPSAQRNVSALMRLTSVTASAGIPARRAAAMIASALGASYRQ